MIEFIKTVAVLVTVITISVALGKFVCAWIDNHVFPDYPDVAIITSNVVKQLLGQICIHSLEHEGAPDGVCVDSQLESWCTTWSNDLDAVLQVSKHHPAQARARSMLMYLAMHGAIELHETDQLVYARLDESVKDWVTDNLLAIARDPRSYEKLVTHEPWR